ncbi:DctM TRAP-type C4-dicarboxylate transport system, small permease component [Rhabdaerophilaceae bacterium]
MSRKLATLIRAVSRRLLLVERALITGFMFLLVGLVLLNVTTRYLGRSIYWVDESAVFSVVWLTFIGASAMTRLRLDFAVQMLTEKLSEANRRRAQIVSTVSVTLFGLLLGWMCWLWLDPAGIVTAGFDAREFSARSFNFVYSERTQTLNWPTWIIYLIMPIFAVSITIHGLANLVEDLGIVPREKHSAFAFAKADGIN